MNQQFKEEFKNLNPEDIQEIINRCAGQDVLEESITKFPQKEYTSKFYLKYMPDVEYGFWIVEWGWKKSTNPTIFLGSGYFEHQIKITPFRLEFQNVNGNSSNPYSSANKRKNVEEYLQVYINKKCPHYIQAVREKTEQFIQMIDIDNKHIKNKDDGMSK
ncbi:MAG: hypothetical protein J6Q51_00855 [Clostridia bacterium]|nr:hypothetical protein [Clostridia bacterium]